MKLYVYQIAPIDDWAGWRTLAEARPNDHSPSNAYGWGPSAPELEDRFDKGSKIARRIGWDGDIRDGAGSVNGGPFWIPVPIGAPSGYDFILAWKQDNDGVTFVASPYQLPWLKFHEMTQGPVVVSVDAYQPG